MKVAKGYKKQVVKLAALIGYTAPKTASAVLAWLDAQQAMEAKVAKLKALAANDNNKAISLYLVEQLAEIMAFTAAKRNTSEAVLNASLCIAMGVGSLNRLRDSQFKTALDYVLTYKAEMVA